MPAAIAVTSSSIKKGRGGRKGIVFAIVVESWCVLVTVIKKMKVYLYVQLLVFFSSTKRGFDFLLLQGDCTPTF